MEHTNNVETKFKKQLSELLPSYNELIQTTFFLSLFLLFKSEIEIILTNYLVTPVLSKIKGGIVGDVGVLLLFGSAIALFFRFEVFHTLKRSSILNFSVLFCLLLYYRFNSNIWIYIGFNYLEHLKYFDLFFLFLLIVLLGKLLRTTGVRENIEILEYQQISEGLPIKLKKQDRFDFDHLAQTVASIVVNSQFTSAYNIGIYSGWGNGKSSLLNLVKNHLPKDNLILLEFNPWRMMTGNSMVHDFLTSLHLKVLPKYHHLATLLEMYSKNFGNLGVSIDKNFINLLFGKLKNELSAQDLYDQINDYLKVNSTKLVILIDDVDRLDSDEIFELLKLIRNVADFRNCFFIITYDKKYLDEALKVKNKTSANYIDKIINIEFNLPVIPNIEIKYWLYDLLKENSSEEILRFVEQQTNPEIVTVVQYDFLSLWLENKRFAVKLVNLFKQKFILLQGEVEIEDLLMIELFRLKYPLVVEFVVKEKLNILTIDNGTFYMYVPSESQPNETYFHVLLKNNCVNFSLSEEEVVMINRFMVSLFSIKSPIREGAKKVLSVRTPSRFDIYFKTNVPENVISMLEFARVRESGHSKLQESIDSWIRDRKGNLIEELLENVDSFNGKVDFENLFRATFYFYNKVLLGEYGYRYMYSDFPIIFNLIEKVRNFKIYDQPTEFDEFVLKLLMNAEFPFRFESKLISLFEDRLTFQSKSKELKELAREFYFESLDRYSIYDNDIYYKFARALEFSCDNFRGKTFIFDDELLKKLKECIRENYKESFFKSIIKGSLSSSYKYKLSEEVLFYFNNSWDCFESFLEGYQNDYFTDQIAEFYEFFKAFKNNNFQEVVFDFKLIKFDRS